MFFGLSLYGVPSINLDKMKGHEIMRKLQILIMVYILTIVLSFMIPARIERVDLGSATLMAEDLNGFFSGKVFEIKENQTNVKYKFYRFRESF